MARRLVFSTSSPNDQGGIIPNDVIDFTRYMKNPVLLKEHMWGSDPLGIMTDIRLIDGKWTGIPVFHCATQASKEAAEMYEKGALKAASIGGEALWKKNPVTDDYVRDAKGFRLCDAFHLYEISLVSLPSNPEAVTEEMLHAKIYEDVGEYDGGFFTQMSSVLTTLSSKFNYAQMSDKNKKNNNAGAAANDGGEGGEQTTTGATGAGNGGEQTTNGATTDINELPPVIRKAINSGVSVTFHAATTNGAPPKPKDEPLSEEGEKETGNPQPEPIGMAARLRAEKLGRQLRKLKSKAEECTETAKKAKKDADDNDGDEMKAAAARDALKTAQEALAAVLAAEKEYEKACEEADEEEENEKAKNAGKPGQRSTMSANRHTTGAAAPRFDNTSAAGQEPQLKSTKDLENELTLAAAPTFKAIVKKDSQGITFTRLNSSKADENDKNLLRRVFNANRDSTATVAVADHAIVLNSILNDPRLRAVVEKTRMMANVNEAQINSMRDNYKGARGLSLQELSAEMMGGRATYWNRSTGQMENLTLLTSTDAALASPALNTIEWLSLAIFELFPTTSWKSTIPMFAVNMTSANTGAIWANIAAEPAVYKGTSPAPAADYTYTDTAVSIALTPYWLQPILWNPLYMHQLRYDQMSTGWAQAFARWNAIMDDNLIYTLASTVPSGAIIPTSGLSGYQAQAQSFNIPGSGAQNKFYWSPNFAGNLLYPTLNDIIAVEQVYRNQNFELEREKGVLVIDPIMERYFSQDPETKSLLTAWVDRNGESFLGFKHTMLDTRSRVAVYDPATGQVKDINGIIPATALSAALGFLPSQVAMGLGMLDVFMIQDPANYGYRMSADIRIGIVPLRANFFGTSLLVYGAANV